MRTGAGLVAAIIGLMPPAAWTQPQGGPKPGTFPGPSQAVSDYTENLVQLELGDQINFKGRVLRMHYGYVGPHGIIGQHSHADRPTMEYVLKGVLTESKIGAELKPQVRRVRKGETEISTIDLTHWWKNETNTGATVMAVDIWNDTTSFLCRPQGAGKRPADKPLEGPTNPGNVKTEDLGTLDLATQLPNIPEAKNYVMRSRRITILPKQRTQLLRGDDNPGITFVVSGDVWENRSDELSSIRMTNEYSVATKGLTYYWENTTAEPVVLWVVDIARKP